MAVCVARLHAVTDSPWLTPSLVPFSRAVSPETAALVTATRGGRLLRRLRRHYLFAISAQEEKPLPILGPQSLPPGEVAVGTS